MNNRKGRPEYKISENVEMLSVTEIVQLVTRGRVLQHRVSHSILKVKKSMEKHTISTSAYERKLQYLVIKDCFLF